MDLNVLMEFTSDQKEFYFFASIIGILVVLIFYIVLSVCFDLIYGEPTSIYDIDEYATEETVE